MFLPVYANGSQEKTENNGLNIQDYKTLHYFDIKNINSPSFNTFRKQLELISSKVVNERLAADLEVLYRSFKRINPNITVSTPVGMESHLGSIWRTRRITTAFK